MVCLDQLTPDTASLIDSGVPQRPQLPRNASRQGTCTTSRAPLAPLTPHSTALPRKLLRHRSQSLAGHHGQILHPPVGQSRQFEERDGPRPYRRAVQHEDRERFAQGSAGEYRAVEGYGHIPGTKTCHGIAGAGTEDEDTGRHGCAIV